MFMRILDLTIIPVLQGVLWAISFLLILYGAYYFLIALFSLKKCHFADPARPSHKFAILIAARNEGAVIGSLVESLMKQDYPTSLFEVFVIPNNCTDNTETAARHAGATILNCTRSVRSKGQVLSFAFDYFLQSGKEFDAFCVFDADNLVDPGFLREMSNQLCSGARVVQGKRESKNPTDSVISACYTIYYCNLNRFYNHARSIIGLSSVVNGTGFMVSADIITELGGWHTMTITEDLEFTAQCALHGIRIHWAPRAVVYDEQPLTFLQSWHQRKRWSSGMQHCLAAYQKPLLRAAIKKQDASCFDILLMFLATHMQLLGALSFILTVSLTAAHVNYSLFPQTDLTFRLLISFDTSYLITVVISAAVLLLEGKSIRKMLKGILFSWFFLFSWIPINSICLFHKTKDWHYIAHTRNVSVEDVIAA
jgi:cellulose synthase/poly-beta-1,6-N-acetylglucosamine synthase-like glycosyltransferase